MEKLDVASVVNELDRFFDVDDPASENPDPDNLEKCTFYLSKRDALILKMLSIKTGKSRQELFICAFNSLLASHGLIRSSIKEY